jgi:enoyl-CoA hydratase/carnithine racemase
MSGAIVLTEKLNHVGIITMDRPTYHVINAPFLWDLYGALTVMENDPDVRVVVLTASGDLCFSRGLDIAMAGLAFKQMGLEVRGAYDDPMISFIGHMGHTTFRRIEDFPKPVIAAINGIALGGGCELATACHLRVMVDRPDVFIGQEEVKIGIIPGWGGCQRLARILGRARALEMILTYKKLSAVDAYNWGLVNCVSKPGEVLRDAMALANNIAEAHAQPLKGALAAVIQGSDASMSDGLRIEQAMSDACWSTPETIKLLATFVEKGEEKLLEENYNFKWAVVD